MSIKDLEINLTSEIRRLGSSECDSSPSIELEAFLHRLPKMDFDKFLLTTWSMSHVDKDQRRVRIPICFGVPILLLRERHERELEFGSSFIEADCPPKVMVDVLAERLLDTSLTIEQTETLLSRTKSVVLFHLILELLRRLPQPLLELTNKSAKLASKVKLLESSHQYDYMISADLYNNIVKQYMEQGDDGAMHYHRTQTKTNTSVHPLVEFYYNREELSRIKWISLFNKFNKCIFYDLHTISSIVQRNLIRFIVRNMIHLMRRYNLSCLRTLRKQRNESWVTASVTTAPHINEYSATKLASLLGPVLISQRQLNEYIPELEKHVMTNMLVTGMDRLWLPGQNPRDILINMEPSFCHRGCVCGKGIDTHG